MRELVFIHSAGGAVDDPEFGSEELIAFLRRELIQDYRIRAPLMPNPEEPHAIAWLDALDAELVDFPDDSVLIGHSMGGAMILKLIAERRQSLAASGLVMIACPFRGEPDWEVEEFYLPHAFADRLSGLKRILLYHSRDDAIVPFAYMAVYHKHIPRAEPMKSTERVMRLREATVALLSAVLDPFRLSYRWGYLLRFCLGQRVHSNKGMRLTGFARR